MVQDERTRGNDEIINSSNNVQAKRRALKDMVIIGGMIFLVPYILLAFANNSFMGIDVRKNCRDCNRRLFPCGNSKQLGIPCNILLFRGHCTFN
jgi:hypothetical protein